MISDLFRTIASRRERRGVLGDDRQLCGAPHSNPKKGERRRCSPHRRQKGSRRLGLELLRPPLLRAKCEERSLEAFWRGAAALRLVSESRDHRLSLQEDTISGKEGFSIVFKGGSAFLWRSFVGKSSLVGKCAARLSTGNDRLRLSVSSQCIKGEVTRRVFRQVVDAFAGFLSLSSF